VDHNQARAVGELQPNLVQPSRESSATCKRPDPQEKWSPCKEPRSAFGAAAINPNLLHMGNTLI